MLIDSALYLNVKLVDNMEKNSNGINTSTSLTDVSRCPMCFKDFSTARIQVHASACNGQPIKPDSVVSKRNENSNNTDITIKKISAETKQIASIFKTVNDRKRPIESDSCELSPENITKISKKDTENTESRQDLSLLSKPSKSVRQPLADLMRPSALEHYMGQDQAIGKMQNGFWRLMIQSISKSDSTAAFPSMIIWVSC